MSDQFTWIPIYQELADKLADWEDKQKELIELLKSLRDKGFLVTPMNDKDKDGSRFLLKEIDPFTFFGVFNRHIRQEQRIGILGEMKKHFNLKSELPNDFNGIPVLNNQRSWFISYQAGRKKDDVLRLWRVFKLALQENPIKNKEFKQAFDDALGVKHTNVNLTMGLYWIRPYTFVNLDSTNRAYLDLRLPSSGLSASFYCDLVQRLSTKDKSFPELSFEAFKHITSEPKAPKSDKKSIYDECNYWLVGAYWDDRDPIDQTDRFLEEGIWENGYDDRYLDDVKSMQVGDKIAIKATSTQRRDLPFESPGETVSRMTIKAIGTIVANRGDGRLVEVEWDPQFEEKVWYFYTYIKTIWRLQTDKDYEHRELALRLIDFVWYNKDQDYEWFLERWYGDVEEDGDFEEPGVVEHPYSIEDIIASGAFLDESELNQLMDRLKSKKTLILQGPPGVGKTYLARKIAFALMEEVDNERLQMVQFHQSYSYDDFVRGYRPNPEKAGSFILQDGIFYTFCRQAAEDSDRDYVFIIDEINRGNLSQIFGELLMLLESDKRGHDYSLPLVYRKEGEERFYVPHNIYLIGLMNVADRSLAMVDYALRRRFAFFDLTPKFGSQRFRDWLLERSMKPELVSLIIDRMTALNREICDDPLLGENYQIGHSYFCPKGDDFAGLDEHWYRGIVQTEIIPLLKEYWFDHHQKAEEAARSLLT